MIVESIELSFFAVLTRTAVKCCAKVGSTFFFMRKLKTWKFVISSWQKFCQVLWPGKVDRNLFLRKHPIVNKVVVIFLTINFENVNTVNQEILTMCCRCRCIFIKRLFSRILVEIFSSKKKSLTSHVQIHIFINFKNFSYPVKSLSSKILKACKNSTYTASNANSIS